MKVSVITVAYNSSKTIAHTLQSVRQQTHGDVEHIVVDGGSTDDTLKIVEVEGAHVAKLVSERDNGIYDAMNKGLALATGDVVAFINSDDFYASSSVLETVVESFNKTGADCCFGDLCYVSQVDPSRIVRYWRSSDFAPGAFGKGWVPPHPTFFARRSIYQRMGGFDLRFNIAADYELMARFLEVGRISSVYIPEVLVKMRLGGASNRGLVSIIKQNLEIGRALRVNGLNSTLLQFGFNKIASRVGQFLKRPSS